MASAANVTSQASGNPFEIAVARFELAELLAARGKRAEARALLIQVPFLRQSVLPARTDRKVAERMARSLGLHGVTRNRKN